MCYNHNMKTVLITGASGDIGSAISRAFARKKYRLLLIYNKNKDRIQSLVEELSKKTEVEAYKCDLTIDNEVHIMIDYFLSKYEEIDCLINCAGISHFNLIQDETSRDYDKVFDTNMKSAFLTTKYVAKSMISAKHGRIINISSMWGRVGSSMESLYSASKGAMNSFTLSLAKELGPSGITVNAICPGLIESKMNAHLDKTTINDIIEDTPMRRIGTPKDVANLTLFLASDEAEFITGQIISVDGGFTL